MVLPVISRGYGIRDDYPDANLSTINSASVSSDTYTSNGDLVTWNVTMTNPSNGDVAVLYRSITGPDPSVYSAATVRYYVAGWPSGTNFQIRYWLEYSPSSTTDTGQSSMPTNTPGFQAVNFPLTNGMALSGNSTSQIGFEILCVTGGTGTFHFSLLLDFIYQYKELLTLPSVTQPITLRKRRNMVELPILGREGGVQQDLGSMSADITVGGHLINSTAGVGQWTNTYTADQWWYILSGLALETGTVQFDSNPTWQWFQSDQIQCKALVTDWLPQQPMGRVQFWDYALQLKKFDLLGENALASAWYNNGAFWDLGPGPGGINY
jgi:hypothetical protein